MGTGITKVTPTAIAERARVAQPRDMGDVFELARAIANAQGLVPRAMLGDPNKVAACMLAGLEMGMGAMEAMRSIHIVEGKTILTSETMLARARAAGVRVQWRGKPEEANQTAHLWLKRGEDEHEEVFTIADAKRAGLDRKDNWTKYPKSMLRARAVSQAMRAFCPDVLGSNVYTDDEADEIAEIASARAPAVGLADGMHAYSARADVVDAETLTELDAAMVELYRCQSDADVVAWVGKWRATVETEPMGPAKRERWSEITKHAKAVTPPMTVDAVKRAFAAARQPVTPDGADYLGALRKAKTPDDVRTLLRHTVGDRLRDLDPQGEEATIAWAAVVDACERVGLDTAEAEAIVDGAP